MEIPSSYNKRNFRLMVIVMMMMMNCVGWLKILSVCACVCVNMWICVIVQTIVRTLPAGCVQTVDGKQIPATGQGSPKQLVQSEYGQRYVTLHPDNRMWIKFHHNLISTSSTSAKATSAAPARPCRKHCPSRWWPRKWWFCVNHSMAILSDEAVFYSNEFLLIQTLRGFRWWNWFNGWHLVAQISTYSSECVDLFWGAEWGWRAFIWNNKEHFTKYSKDKKQRKNNTLS